MACGATLKRTLEFDPLMSPTSPKRRRCVPVSPSSSSPSPRKYLSLEPSPFGESSSRLSAEQILNSIKQEYKRIQKRKHVDGSCQQSECCCAPDSPPQSSMTVSSMAGTSCGGVSPSRREQPLFTLRQVGMICERLLKEREEKVREEYEETMTSKLAEQYDTFVKFTHDQLMRRFGEQPASYVS
ncbi:akirin-2-like [Salarias fasciatus]|uniref:Akirin-2 n=1 Tax=Salarias fasciatus TaxID=181472 RepID=A0A672GSN9_SALFA|nr:akirin-2-like [Salarias fasciatus]